MKESDQEEYEHLYVKKKGFVGDTELDYEKVVFAFSFLCNSHQWWYHIKRIELRKGMACRDCLLSKFRSNILFTLAFFLLCSIAIDESVTES